MLSNIFFTCPTCRQPVKLLDANRHVGQGIMRRITYLVERHCGVNGVCEKSDSLAFFDPYSSPGIKFVKES
jgi:hypothetical protein